MASRGKSSKAKNGACVPIITEMEANRQTVDAFEQLTRDLRISRVPIFFRSLAALKAMLPSYQALRPLLRLRAFEEAADDLRAFAAQVAHDLGCPLIETQLEHAGYDVDEIDEIRAQVDVFHYQHPKVLMVASLLASALDGGVGAPQNVSGRATQKAPRGAPEEMAPVELVPDDAGGALGKTLRSIRTHLDLGLVPESFRALGRWPKYLELAWADARGRDSAPRAKQAVDELRRQARALAEQMPLRVELGEAALAAAGVEVALLRETLDRYLSALPCLVLDFALFKAQLDGAAAARESPFPIRWKYLASDDYMPTNVDQAVRLRAGDPTELDEPEARQER